MENVQRYDLGTLRPARRMSDGRVRADAYITRVGVFRYTRGDGSVQRELRHPDDVLSRASLDSFAQVPVTNDHPPVGLVTSRNARQYAVGATDSHVRPDGDHVVTEIVVFDGDTIDAMDAGKVELSGGYTCDLEMIGGVDPTFGAYDARQRNIRGNHVAIVDRGRAGPTVRARMDGMMLMELHVGERVPHSPCMDPTEALRTVNAQLKDAEKARDDIQLVASTEKTRADVASGELEIAKKKIGELTAQIASNAAATESAAVQKEKERADGLAAKVARFDETFRKAVVERATLERSAALILGNGFRMDDLNDRQIRTEVVKKLDVNVDVSPKIEDGVVTGMFNALVAGHLKQARQIADVGDHLAESIDDVATRPAREDELEKKRRDFRERGLRPLPSDLRSRRQ